MALHVEIDAPEGASRGRRHLAGRTPTVVFVPRLRAERWSAGSSSAGPWCTPGFRVVAYDQRGHGRSGAPHLDSCTVDQLGRDLDAVLAATCPTGPVVLVGHSMGGMTVMSYAGQHPEAVRDRVLAVALVSTSPGGHEITEMGLGAMAGQGRRLARAGCAHPPLPPRRPHQRPPPDGQERAGRRRRPLGVRQPGEPGPGRPRGGHDLRDLVRRHGRVPPRHRRPRPVLRHRRAHRGRDPRAQRRR